MTFDWNELAFGNKSAVNDLQATFIGAPRTISNKRLKQLLKEYLPAGNIVLGIAKESFVIGLEDQPQFTMLKKNDTEKLVASVNAAKTPHKLFLLEYSQRDLAFLLEKLKFKKAVFVNGSWYTAFHFRPEYYALIKKQIPYELVSPFASEQEAREYIDATTVLTPDTRGAFSQSEVLELVNQVAKQSYDYSSLQTATILAKKDGNSYRVLATAHNKIIPFETYAMHYGPAKEQHFAPPNDLNHSDTIHAEVQLILTALKNKINITDTTLFINLLPCPNCSRMIAESPIAEVVYQQDHSSGYAVKLLESCGKVARRVVL